MSQVTEKNQIFQTKTLNQVQHWHFLSPKEIFYCWILKTHEAKCDTLMITIRQKHAWPLPFSATIWRTLSNKLFTSDNDSAVVQRESTPDQSEGFLCHSLHIVHTLSNNQMVSQTSWPSGVLTVESVELSRMENLFGALSSRPVSKSNSEQMGFEREVRWLSQIWWVHI